MHNKLFYVEDDEVLAQLTVNALRRYDFQVAHFPNICAAKLALDQPGFSHALLDMNLSDGNALALIADLVNHQPAIKILLLTGYASIATAVQAIKLGAHNYLAKPASIEEIMTAFGEHVGMPNAPSGAMSLGTMSLKRLEWEKIQQALTENNGNISLTAKQLNMHRRTLQRKLSKKPVAQ